MRSVNQVELIGYVGKDPEVQTFSNGNAIVKFSVATSEKWKDKQSGEDREKTCWHNIQCRLLEKGPGKFIESSIRKGDLVRIFGTIDNGSYQDKEGVTKYFSNIVIPPYVGSVDKFYRDSQGGAVGSDSVGHASDPLDDDVPF